MDGSRIIGENRTTGSTVDKLRYYYDTTGVCGFNYNGTEYYYQKNLQGDIVKVYNASGSLVAEYRYDAWGKCSIITNTNGIADINPYRYRSYYFDNETGLYYLNSRYYDAEVGRFISADSVDYLEPESINGLNLYAYCLNNPVMYYDPSGNFAITGTIIAWIIGALAAMIMLGMMSLLNHQTHIFTNFFNELGNFAVTLIDNILDAFSSIGTGFLGVTDFSIFSVEDLVPGNIVYKHKSKGKYKRNKPAKRDRSNTKKEAKEKAKRAGNGKPPIGPELDKNGKNPHYHPNVPNNDPRIHDHYYFPKRFFGLLFWNVYDDEE